MDAQPMTSIYIEKLDIFRNVRDIGVMTPTCYPPAFSPMDFLGPLAMNHRSVMNRTRDTNNLSQNDCAQLEL